MVTNEVLWFIGVTRRIKAIIWGLGVWSTRWTHSCCFWELLRFLSLGDYIAAVYEGLQRFGKLAGYIVSVNGLLGTLYDLVASLLCVATFKDH